MVFDPTRAGSAPRVAAGFVVLLLPYSVLGPFVGVLLDRWRRQRVLVGGGLLKAAVTVLTAGLLGRYGATATSVVLAGLVVLSVNRFVLAAHAAALPHVVRGDRLVQGNAVAPTAGTLATVAGAAAGVGVRAAAGGGPAADAVVMALAAMSYAASALVAGRLPLRSLGPDQPYRGAVRTGLTTATADLVAGLRHLRARPPAAAALAVVAGQRLAYALWTVQSVLLFRDGFVSHGVLRSGLSGLGELAAAAGVGLLLAALVTPALAARIGPQRVVVLAGTLAAAGCGLLCAPLRLGPWLAGAVVLGAATQATKICVDTVVQTAVDDRFRGRVFTVYDTVFSTAFVLGAVLAAAVLPPDGRSRTVVVATAVGYAAVAVGYAVWQRPPRLTGRAARPAASSSR